MERSFQSIAFLSIYRKSEVLYIFEKVPLFWRDVFVFLFYCCSRDKQLSKFLPQQTSKRITRPRDPWAKLTQPPLSYRVRVGFRSTNRRDNR